MKRAPATHPLGVHLETLYADAGPARIQRDPLRFAHRYAAPEDAEIAGLIAALYAFGRVDLFLPVLDRLFDQMDALGGPRAFVRVFGPEHRPRLDGVTYRWTKPDDLAVFLSAIQEVLREHRGLEQLFAGSGTLRDRLGRAITTLRTASVAASARLGKPVGGFSKLSLGVRHLLPHPDDGSACKRWNLFLRWMVRPTTERIDLGLWRSVAAADLLIPLDVHVGRLSRFLGLTQRTDASWRTAEEITARLRLFDREDPVRFDFALAHQGISGGCLGYRHAPVCEGCVIRAVCRAPTRAG